jgi:DNA-binding transcriptional LysR family regulator
MEVDSRPGITRSRRPKRTIFSGAVNAQQFSATFKDHSHASKVVFGVLGVPGGGKRAFEKPILSRLQGTLRINASVAFGRRVLTPLVLKFMQQHPGLQIELGFEDRYVNLVEQGVDLAIRMGRLADSTLGSRYLGLNPWLLVAFKAYLSALLAAARAAMGLAVLPCYVAQESIDGGSLLPLLERWTLPAQEIHAVFPSPRHVPEKVNAFISWMQGQFDGDWWTRKP